MWLDNYATAIVVLVHVVAVVASADVNHSIAQRGRISYHIN